MSKHLHRSGHTKTLATVNKIQHELVNGVKPKSCDNMGRKSKGLDSCRGLHEVEMAEKEGFEPSIGVYAPIAV